MADETLRVNLDTKGKEKIDAATASVDKLKTTVTTVTTATTVSTQATTANTAATTTNTAATQTNTTTTTANTTATTANTTATTTNATTTTASATATAQATQATQANTAATATNTATIVANTTATAANLKDQKANLSQATAEVLRLKAAMASLATQPLTAMNTVKMDNLKTQLQGAIAQATQYRATVAQIQATMGQGGGGNNSKSSGYGGKGGGPNLGMSVLFASQAIEDLQYGIGGVVNNIPMLAMALGAGAGVAGAASLAAVAINQLVKHLDDLGISKGAVTQAEYLKKLGEAARLSAEDTKRLTELSATVEGGKKVLSQETPIGVDAKATSKDVQGVTDQIGGNHLADMLARTRTQSDEQLKGFLGTTKGWGGTTEQQQFQNLLNAKARQGGELSAEQTTQFNALAKIAREKADEQAAQDIADLQNGSADQRKVKAQQIAGDLDKTAPEIANRLRMASDPRAIQERNEAESLARQQKFNEQRGQGFVDQTMTRPGDKTQENAARELLEKNNIPASTANYLIKRQTELLQERQTLLEEQLKAQGYTEEQIAKQVEQAQRTKAESEALALASSVMTRPNDAGQANRAIDLLRSQDFDQEAINAAIGRQNKTLQERQALLRSQLQAQGFTEGQIAQKLNEDSKTGKEKEDEDKRAKQRERALDVNRRRLDYGREVAGQVMGPGGSFTESAQAAVQAALGGDEQAAFMVMDELTKKQRERIDLLREEMKAQGYSNAEIAKEIELKTTPKKELEREQRLLSQTGFNVNGVGNDILALTRSRQQGGMGLSLDQAQAFEKQQLTDAMMMQGFNRTDAGKMADSLVRDSEAGVKDAMEDLARTMPDSIQGMKDLMRQQMEAANRLERNGIKMVLGRR